MSTREFDRLIAEAKRLEAFALGVIYVEKLAKQAGVAK